MTSCEMCGTECKGCRKALVEGVTMLLCPDCIKHGENMGTVQRDPVHVQRFVKQQARKPKPKDIYKEMKKELVSNWAEIIKNARIKKELSREQLGFKIGERTVTIAKIENGDLRPSDKVIEKLEKELEISLMEEVKTVSASSAHSRAGMTLGDFIKTEK